MPFVNAKLSATPSPELTSRAIALLVDLTTKVLRKERSRTTVVIEYVPAGQWSVGGAPIEPAGVRRFYVEAKITAGTNSREDKARYVHEVQRGFESLLGAGRALGYVAVQELAADSWGHGGETQEMRYVKDSFVFQTEQARKDNSMEGHEQFA